MEIQTNLPEFFEVKGLFVEFQFLGGKAVQWFIRQDEVYTEGEAIIYFEVKLTNGDIEKINVERRNLIWWSTRVGINREPNLSHPKWAGKKVAAHKQGEETYGSGS